MLYFDTSFLAPLFKSEERSLDVAGFVAALLPRAVGMSEWTRVEFSSLLAREVRIGRMMPVQADEAESEFATFVVQRCTVLDVARRDFDLARLFLADHRSGLRSGDALHLAVASNAAASGVYSLDRIMIAVGRSLGLPINAGFPAGS